MSESPAGARLNFAMRGDVRLAQLSSVGAVVACQQGPIADRDERYGDPSASRPSCRRGGTRWVRPLRFAPSQAGRHLDRDRHFAHLKRIARQVKAVDDAGARAQAGESLQLLAPSARLRAQGIS
jgi:hypothetical protein